MCVKLGVRNTANEFVYYELKTVGLKPEWFVLTFFFNVTNSGYDLVVRN